MRIIIIMVSILTLFVSIGGMAAADKPFAPNVDLTTGDIRVPPNYHPQL